MGGLGEFGREEIGKMGRGGRFEGDGRKMKRWEGREIEDGRK